MKRWTLLRWPWSRRDRHDTVRSAKRIDGMESTQPHYPDPVPVKSHKIRVGLVVAAIVLAGLFALGMAPRLRNRGQLATETQETASSVPAVSVVSPHFAAGGDLLLPGNIEAIEETSV